MNTLAKKVARSFRRVVRLDVKQPPQPAEKAMVGLFSTLTDAQKAAAMGFKGNHNVGGSEHRLKGDSCA